MKFCFEWSQRYSVAIPQFFIIYSMETKKETPILKVKRGQKLEFNKEYTETLSNHEKKQQNQLTTHTESS